MSRSKSILRGQNPDRVVVELEPIHSPSHPKLLVNNDEATEDDSKKREDSLLLDALEVGDITKLRRAMALEKDHINQPYGTLRITLLHLAAFHQPHLVPVLLKNGAEVKALDAIGRSAFHLACTAATDPVCVKILIDAGADVDQRILLPLQLWTPNSSRGRKNIATESKKWHFHGHAPAKQSTEDLEHEILNVKYPKTGIGSDLPVPECLGRTGLHQAVKAAHPEIVKILLDAGATVDSKDQKGLTPLLLAGAGVSPDDSEGVARYEAVVQMLVKAGADVNILNPHTGTTALHHAAARCSLGATQLLVKHGAVVDKISATGATAVHEAAHSGAQQVLQFLLEMSEGLNLVNKQDHVGLTPLHKAAFSGNRGCLELLLKSGGHLAMLTHSGTSVLDAVFMHIARPYHFLITVFDECVHTNNVSVLDRAFKVHLDFCVLAPHGCDRQTSILREIFNSPNGLGHAQLLRHPLLETFLWLKWQKLRIFFFILLFIYGSFLCSLTLFAIISTDQYIVSLKSPNAKTGQIDKIVKQGSGYILLGTSILLLLHISIQALLRPLFYVREIETWIFAFCGSMSIVIVLNSDKHFLGDGEFTKHLLAVVVLLAWTELMLLIGRFPTWGNYALMFYTVLRNVMKVMLTFVFIVIGFTLSFYVQFGSEPIFNDPWRSFVKTIVMMAGEFEYKDLFDRQNSTADGSDQELNIPFTSRLIFLTFVILTTIVMMNLMVGLAVSDIQAVQAEGHFRRLLKQAQFVDHLETIISHPIFTKFLPKVILFFLSRRRRVLTELTLQPSAVESKTRHPNRLPRRLVESCVELAVRQRAITQLKMDEEILDEDSRNSFSWLDARDDINGASSNAFGMRQQAVLEDMMLRVFEELKDLKNFVQTSTTVAAPGSSLPPPLPSGPPPIPRTLSRKESRRLHLPRGSGQDRQSRIDDAVCEVQGAQCMLRRMRD